MMILEIDQGNSRTKWRFKESLSLDSPIVSRGAENNDQAIDLLISDALAFRGEDLNVYIATVVPENCPVFVERFVSSLGVEPVFASVGRSMLGVTNGYEVIEQMGVDRWLALVAGFGSVGGTCLVVNSGTALTVDLMLASGVHCGGYIAPGVDLMRKALFRDTGRVKLAEIDYDDALSAGRSTKAAVSSALVAMQLGLIEKAISELEALSGDVPVIIFSGGAGERLMEILDHSTGKRFELIFSPELVLDGLTLASLESSK